MNDPNQHDPNKNHPPKHLTQDASDLAHLSETIHEKLVDAQTPGYQAEFDPEEAERAGAFTEDALSEDDALQSIHDLHDALTDKPPPVIFQSSVLDTHWPLFKSVKPVFDPPTDKEG